MNLSSFDLATRLTGWCAGDGSSLPTCDAWAWPHVGEDLGHLLELFDRALGRHFEEHRPDAVVYEAPILVVNKRQPRAARHEQRDPAPGYTDKPAVLRKLYSLGGHLEWACRVRGVRCYEIDLKAIKRELAGRSHAEKHEMVAAAERLGVILPALKSEGREDAADAFGGWLLGGRKLFSRDVSAAWDRRLWSSRGALV